MKRIALLLAMTLAGCSLAGRGSHLERVHVRRATVPMTGDAFGALIVQTTRGDTMPGSHVMVLVIDPRIVDADAAVVRRAATDPSGVVTLDSLPAGEYRLELRGIGLARFATPVTVRPGFADTLSVALRPIALPEMELDVSGHD